MEEDDETQSPPHGDSLPNLPPNDVAVTNLNPKPQPPISSSSSQSPSRNALDLVVHTPANPRIGGGRDDCESVGEEADSECESVEAETTPPPFIPSLGAWAKPLHFTPLPSSGSSTPKGLDASGEALNWPSLSLGQQPKQSRAPSKKVPQMPGPEVLKPAVKEDGSLRFPWAAKMNPSLRNLYRTTSPSYLQDGTPKVKIPSEILLHGPENQKEYIVGKFYQCVIPSGGLVHAVVNRLWGRNCKIFVKKLGESSFLFHIPDEATRTWIIHRSLWHVDGCLMFVAPWTSTSTLTLPEISSAPVWVTLRNIPDGCYSIWGISQIASGLGEPIKTVKPRLDPTQMGEAKILVEVELDKPFHPRVAAEDEDGTISMVDVVYSWIPSKCSRCGLLGHKEKRCLTTVSASSESEKVVGSNVQLTTALPSEHLLETSNVENASNVDKDISRLVEGSPPKVSQTAFIPSIVVTDPPSLVTPSVASPCNISEVSTIMVDTTTPIVVDATHSTDLAMPLLEDHITTPATDQVQDTEPLAHGEFQQTSFNAGTYSGYDSSPDLGMRTRGGRHIRPTKKLQEMQWTKGRGKRGRGGH